MYPPAARDSCSTQAKTKSRINTTAHASRVPRTSPKLAKHRDGAGITKDRVFAVYGDEEFLVKVGHVEGSLEYQKFYQLVQQR